jgi:hypothetical protein
VTRSHRAWHARVWLVLGPLVVAGLFIGLIYRRPLPTQNGADSGTTGPHAAAVDTARQTEDQP